MATKDILTSEEYYLTIERLVAAGIIETPPSMYDLMACLSNDPDMAGEVTPNLDERREGRGFTYHCANGYEVSVQWGEGYRVEGRGSRVGERGLRGWWEGRGLWVGG